MLGALIQKSYTFKTITSRLNSALKNLLDNLEANRDRVRKAVENESIAPTFEHNLNSYSIVYKHKCLFKS